MRSVEEIDDEIGKVDSYRAKLQIERKRAVMDRHGVKPGDIVTAKRGYGPKRTTEDALVVHVDTRWIRPWLTVRFKNKDGSWSKADRNVYHDWEVKA